MTAACVCPDIPAPDHVGAGPIVCTCCGQPLVITCPGECGEAHVRESIERAKPKRTSTVRPTARVYQPRVCRCGATFTPTGPRGDKCPDCRGGAR